jgi:hypothetical protein
MGGIYNYVNLHAYHYAGNNPIKYVDPDGNTTWLPLTYSALWSNAFRSGAIDPNNDYGPNNNIIGLALERAVGQIFGMQRNNVNFPNNISSSRVRPDFVGRSNFAFVDEHGRVSSTVFPTGNFIEAKTSRIVNGEGSGNNQIFAMIDALSNQRSANGEMTAGEARAGYLYLVTPADTVITQDVVSYATLKNVRLHQFTAEYNKDNPNQIRLGRGQPLNFLDGGQIILAPRRTGTLDY